MNILVWIFAIIIGYFFLIFVGLRLVVPFLGFGQYRPKVELPSEIKEVVRNLENSVKTEQEYLQAVFNIVMEKNNTQWQHTRFQAAFKIPRLFVSDLKEIWETKKFVYCTAINFVAYAFLVGSKYFKPEEIRARHTFVNMVIHQYLQIKVQGLWVDFDPAGSGIRGKPLGTHLSFFG